jgi:signal transduction histidine kinase
MAFGVPGAATNVADEPNSPTPIQPTWDQLMNGSLDTQFVEVRGMIGSLQNRKDGWSAVELRTRNGVLKLVLLRSGLRGALLEKSSGSVVRVRGHLSVDRDSANQRVIAGQIRMRDAELIVDQPVPVDMFAVPAKTAAALTRSDPEYDVFRWVKVSGQIIHVRSRLYFLMDGRDGLRFVTDKPLNLEAGDLVEVSGYQDVLSAAAPVLRGAVARKTGHAPLPQPRPLSAEDLVRPAFDSTWVRVEGLLSNVRQTGSELVLEIHSGQWRYWARLNVEKEPAPPLPIGSRLELTGTYCAQGEYKVIGPDVAALDLLLNSPSNIKLVSKPAWWTLQRLLVVVGVLVCLLIATMLWVTQLHRQVRLRTAELGAQIQQRQRAEHAREMEMERTRIAQDLHDELGSGITEISMLAARARSESTSKETRPRHLEEIGEKARAVVTALDEIVWTMNPRHDSLASLVSYFSLYADRFLGLANIAWRLESPGELPDHLVNSHQRHQLFLAFKEALNNVVRHAGATEVRLIFRIENGELQLAVADNGRGLATGDRTQAMDGVANMRSRVEKLGGRFEIVSEPESGMTVWFCVPINQNS